MKTIAIMVATLIISLFAITAPVYADNEQQEASTGTGTSISILVNSEVLLEILNSGRAQECEIVEVRGGGAYLVEVPTDILNKLGKTKYSIQISDAATITLTVKELNELLTSGLSEDYKILDITENNTYIVEMSQEALAKLGIEDTSVTTKLQGTPEQFGCVVAMIVMLLIIIIIIIFLIRFTYEPEVRTPLLIGFGVIGGMMLIALLEVFHTTQF